MQPVITLVFSLEIDRRSVTGHFAVSSEHRPSGVPAEWSPRIDQLDDLRHESPLRYSERAVSICSEESFWYRRGTSFLVRGVADALDSMATDLAAHIEAV